MFFLRCPDHFVEATGRRSHVPPGPLHELERHVQAHFAQAASGGGPAVVVGALPFDPNADGALYQPAAFRRADEYRAADAMPPAVSAPQIPDGQISGGTVSEGQISAETVRAIPTPADYAANVSHALAMIARGEVDKVVLSRSLRIETASPADPRAIARRLAQDPAVTIFCTPLPASAADPAHLVGATPELLVSRRGSHVASHPLAGSAARHCDAVQDRAIADALLCSEKDRREHGMVVEAILDALTPVCSHLSTPAGTTLHSTATMWHLGTRIAGRLKPDAPSAAGLAALLHPTPAVGGAPRSAALDAIRMLEPHDRGFYAGAVGWTDAGGDGEWFLALRCAEIAGRNMTLYAGAGVVAGSDPIAEVKETAAKFGAMLRALDMEEAVGIMQAAH